MLIETPDGRVLEVVDAGGDGFPVVLHGGTPGGPVLSRTALEAAEAAGLRLITYGRPGYGASTPQPGRTVADAATDTATLLDALGLDGFVTLGFSGGGPHALACAALLPDRCRAAASVAGIAPDGQADLDWLAGMGAENVEELGAARLGRAALEPLLAEWSAPMIAVTAADVTQPLEGLLPPVDRAALSGELGEWLAAAFRKAFEHGYAGWLDDDLAFAAPWGFDLGAVTVPVAVWQGGQDLMVPPAHGQWLATAVPGATAHLEPEHGHLSLTVSHLPEVLRQLAATT